MYMQRMLDNSYEFKKYFTLLLNKYPIMPICTSIKNPHYNVTVECIHQVIYNIIVTRDLDEQIMIT